MCLRGVAHSIILGKLLLHSSKEIFCCGELFPNSHRHLQDGHVYSRPCCNITLSHKINHKIKKKLLKFLIHRWLSACTTLPQPQKVVS